MKLLAAVALISGALTGLTLAQEATILSVKITETTFQQNRVDPVAFVVGLVRSANTGFTEDIDIKAELAITSIPAANVDALVARAADLDPTYAPVNFNSWFSVILVGKTEDGKKKVHPEDNGVPRREVIDELVKKLAQMPEVESVEFIVEAIPAAPVFPSDDPRTVDQGYLNTAALGVDARYAWERPGGDGEFASVVDVEWDWLLDHEDLVRCSSC
jgi:serine protease